MSPCLLPGDRLTFRALAADEARVGDILVVDGPFGFVVHRLIAIGDGVLWLRGDANTDDDAAVSWAQVIGRVCAATRKTRQISLERRWLRGAFAKAFAEVRRRASA